MHWLFVTSWTSPWPLFHDPLPDWTTARRSSQTGQIQCFHCRQHQSVGDTFLLLTLPNYRHKTATSLTMSLTWLSVGFCPMHLRTAVSSCQVKTLYSNIQTCWSFVIWQISVTFWLIVPVLFLSNSANASWAKLKVIVNDKWHEDFKRCTRLVAPDTA